MATRSRSLGSTERDTPSRDEPESSQGAWWRETLHHTVYGSMVDVATRILYRPSELTDALAREPLLVELAHGERK